MMDTKAVTKTTIILVLIIVILAAGLIYYATLPPPAPLPTPTPPPGPATVTGKVTDAKTGAAVAGATVTLDGLKYVTGPDGTYSFSVKVGKYAVTVSMTGYETKTASVDASAEKTYTVNVSIPPIPPPTSIDKIIRQNLEKIVGKFVVVSQLPVEAGVEKIMSVSELNYTPEKVKQDILNNAKLPEPPFSGPIPPEKFNVLSPDDFAWKFGGELKLDPSIIQKALNDFKGSVRSELEAAVKPGDFVAILVWSSKVGLKFLSLALVDGATLAPNYDSFMRFVPIGRKDDSVALSTMGGSMHEKHHEVDMVNMSGSIITVFPNRPWLYVTSSVEARLGISATAIPDERSFALTVSFNTALNGVFASFAPWFLDAGVALGAPYEGAEVGTFIRGKTLSSNLWLDGSQVTFYGDRFTYRVLEYREAPEVVVEVIGVTYKPPDYSKYTSIEVQPRDPDRVEVLNYVRVNKGIFAGDGARFVLEGAVKAPQKGRIYFQADVLLTTDWNWLVLDNARTFVWDDV